MKIKFVLWGIVMLTFFSCNRGKLGVKEYLNYYSTDKSFEASQVSDSLELTARILSKEFMGLVTAGSQVVDMPGKEIDSLIALTEDFSYVFLDLKNKYFPSDMLCWGCADSISLEARINYLSENFNQSLCIVSGKDTIPCAITQLERTFKLNDKTRILLGFDCRFNELKAPLSLIIKPTNRIDHQQHLLEFTEFDNKKVKILSL
ncbi:MAG: hypothetical protein V4643_06975 [Bacteroidota bacterium]